MIGELLGNRYELLEKIGEGGMSIVYKARCNKLNRFVAVKILKSEFSDNEEIVRKFKIEATAIATLSHINIVNVLDVGTQDNINYIVMEYVNGKTLKEVIKQSLSVNFESAIDMAIQIGKALECAHKNGIIHRDVKPQNILVTQDGLVKVTDFGIAKSVASSTMTTTTTIMGSAHYFSPEQAKGEVVDTRTDLYSFGIVIYEMVTGKLPFQADSPVTIALKHIQEEVVPPKKINSKVPNSLNDLILKLMSKSPNDRYQTANDTINDLQKIKDDPNVILGNENAKSIDLDDGRTIVMNAVNPSDLINHQGKGNDDDYDDDEYYDDDDYYEDDDYYDDDDDHEIKTKKNKKILIGILCGIIGVIIIFLGAYFIFSGNNKGSNNISTTKVAIPTLQGLTLDQAEVALKRVGLEIVDAGTEKSNKERGTVVEVDPTEGSKVEKGSKVRIITSEGPDTVAMPDFTESDLGTVKTFLSKNGITNVTYVKQYSDTIGSGYVISTDPDAKTKISSDTKVTVYVSQGSEIKYVNVDDVTGLTVDKATNKLKNAGLKVNIIYKDVDRKDQDGIVQQQSDSGSVQQGTTITIYVGKYTAPVATSTPK